GFPTPSGRFYPAYRRRGPGITASSFGSADASPPGPNPNFTVREVRRVAGHAISFAYYHSIIPVGTSTRHYSHSMVLGGLELMSYTTRLMPLTSLTIRVEMRSNTSAGSRVQSAVMASSESTTRTAIVNP